MRTEKVLKEIALLTKSYPRFADGRIDYTNEHICPVIVCTVVHDNEVLLTHRSAEVIAYPDTWNGIAGFIDEIKPLETIAQEELAEEVGIIAKDIKRIEVRDKVVQIDKTINRQWIVFPVLVELYKKPAITTNWENKEAKWLPINHIDQVKIVPFYPEVFKAALQERQ